MKTRSAVLIALSLCFALPAAADVTIQNVVVSASGGDGVRIDSETGVNLQTLTSSFNGQAGIRVLRADGNGLQLLGVDSVIHDNVSDGIILGDLELQSGKIVAFIELAQVYNNEVGIRVQQKDAADYSTTTTMHGNIIYNNRGSGVHFRTSYLKHRVVGETFYKTSFTSNKVFHNAMGEGCTSPQTAPQIRIQGPVSVTAEQSASCATEDENVCRTAGAAGEPCYWGGSSCVTVWDLRGALDCDDNTANPNQIHSYNTSSDPIGTSELSVGLYASEGAEVWADNNSWRTGDESQNVDQDASSFVDADTICPAGGILLQCSDQ